MNNIAMQFSPEICREPLQSDTVLRGSAAQWPGGPAG